MVNHQYNIKDIENMRVHLLTLMVLDLMVIGDSKCRKELQDRPQSATFHVETM